ncbi:hypothetical protein [Methylicorpusculum sp.]|uniref:hypothetical protein n=1 Tax=Methylicorpusculum sp. TaxID=2713644 RepID=UPI00272BE966|nr:hypothetical protein [Methylicorpusculum sp.]
MSANTNARTAENEMWILKNGLIPEDSLDLPSIAQINPAMTNWMNTLPTITRSLAPHTTPTQAVFLKLLSRLG